MKYSSLLWSGLWRKPARTVFTFISVIVAFLLFGLLHGVTAGMDALIDQMDPNRMRVQGEGNRRELLPVSHGSQIARLPHVESVAAAAWFGGYYQDPKNSVGAIALGSDFQWDKTRELAIPAAQVAAFKRTRTGAVIGRVLANRYGWKIGDHVPVTTHWLQRDGSNVWYFDIVGIYDVPLQPSLATDFWLHYDYLEEGRAILKGTTNTFILYTTDERFNVQVAQSIDQMFANSRAPTATQSDREWQRAAWKQILDVNLIVNAMVGAALFTLLLLVANTMMQSVTQRISELAVLKAIGFTDPKILTLVAAEALALCVLGAAIGLAISKTLFPLFAHSVDLDSISMPLEVPLTGIAIAVVAALIISLVPALRARRLSVVDALAHR